MNDLRRILLWLSALGVLAIGIWGLQWDERSNARPFSPEFRAFRMAHRTQVLGHVFYVPLRRMVCGWAAVTCAAAALWPLATSARSSHWLAGWERTGNSGATDGRKRR